MANTSLPGGKLFALHLKSKSKVASAAYIASNCHTSFILPTASPTTHVDHRGDGSVQTLLGIPLNDTWPAWHREVIVKRLIAEGLSVSAMGACSKNADIKAIGSCAKYGPRAKFCAMSSHLFYFAFENSVFPDYVTEKLYEPLAVGTIPVYIGAPNVAEYAPAPHSLIRVADFPSPKALVDYLQCVARNETVKQYYLQWRSRTTDRWRLELISESSSPTYRLCDLLVTSKLESRSISAPQMTEIAELEASKHRWPDQRPLDCS